MDECQPNNTRIAGLEPEEGTSSWPLFYWHLFETLASTLQSYFCCEPLIRPWAMGHGDIYHSAMLPMLVFDIVIPHGLLFTYASCKKSKSEIRRNIFVFLLAVVNKRYILKAKGKRFNNLYNAMWALCLKWLGCTVGRVHSSFMLIQKTKYLVIKSWTRTVSYFILSFSWNFRYWKLIGKIGVTHEDVAKSK